MEWAGILCGIPGDNSGEKLKNTKQRIFGARMLSLWKINGLILVEKGMGIIHKDLWKEVENQSSRKYA